MEYVDGLDTQIGHSNSRTNGTESLRHIYITPTDAGWKDTIPPFCNSKYDSFVHQTVSHTSILDELR